MTREGSNNEAGDAGEAWRLAQLGRLAEAVGELGQGVREQLDAFVPEEVHATGGAALDADRLHAVRDDVCALRDTAEQVGMLGSSLAPRDRPLQADLEELAAAAAGALIEGISDLWMVELTVRMLDRTQGFPALAEAIELDPLGCVAGWEDTTVGGLLDSFRGDGAGSTAAVCAQAGVSSDARWSSLGAEELHGVCAALRDAATRP